MSDRVTFREVFARFLRDARGDRSQSDIARAMADGTKPQSVSEWESAKNLPESRRFERLLVVLGVDGIGAAIGLNKAAKAMQAEQAQEAASERQTPASPSETNRP